MRQQPNELHKNIHRVYRSEAAENVGLVRDLGAAASEIGQGTDDDKRDVLLVRDQSNGGAFHFHRGGVEFGAEESPVSGVVDEDACTHSFVNDGYLWWSREARGVHALW